MQENASRFSDSLHSSIMKTKLFEQIADEKDHVSP